MERRKQFLQEYFKWKMRTWRGERKPDDSKKEPRKSRRGTNTANTPKMIKMLVCRICLNKIRAEKMSEHSDTCFTRTHLVQEIENLKRQLQKFVTMSQEQKRKYLLRNKMERYIYFQAVNGI